MASEWHRVRVEEVGEASCLCLFLDHGDRDRVEAADLRELKPEFLMVAPQAVAVEVAGLEEYQQREDLLPTVNQLLLGKALVARVEDRAALGARLVQGETPRLIFFDTSRPEEDVNINQRLIELIVSEDARSRLPAVGGEEVRVVVTSVSEGGELRVSKAPGAAGEQEGGLAPLAGEQEQQVGPGGYKALAGHPTYSPLTYLSLLDSTESLVF